MEQVDANAYAKFRLKQINMKKVMTFFRFPTEGVRPRSETSPVAKRKIE